MGVITDDSRDSLLTDFGKETLKDRYVLPGESYQRAFARVAEAFADDEDHAQRVYDYMSKLWFMPATPVLSNGGAQRGLPISCFLNAVEDSMESIGDTWIENMWLAANGGGIGTYWGGVRSIGEKVKDAGQTSGIVPFIGVMDRLALAVSQGSLRRGSVAVYLDVHHPEIEEFIELRKPHGDLNRKSLNLHHGVNIDDAFMIAVRDGTDYDLRSPKSGRIIKKIDARALWEKILHTRVQTGEPYLVFIDTVNRSLAAHQRQLGLSVKQSNLCSEIMLHTGRDHLGKDRTAVCCLSSVNAEKFLEWKDHPTFIMDLMRFLDNVLQDFIDRAPPAMKDAVYSAMRERSVGLGLMGFHSFLQSQGLPFESVMAKSWNMRMFKHLRQKADEASVLLADERGPCPDAAEVGVFERFSHKLSIAPTASISIICGGTSPGIDPVPANIYVHKTLSGSFLVKNPYLEELIDDYAGKQGMPDSWVAAQWDAILEGGGSVQHLDWMHEDDKAVFRTSFEIDQRWIIELARDRTEFICQSQSVNLFLPGDVQKWDLHMLHFTAWLRGMKSLYYLRSLSVQRGGHAGDDMDFDVDGEVTLEEKAMVIYQPNSYEDCLSCQ